MLPAPIPPAPLRFLWLAPLAVVTVLFALTWDQPLLEAHAFRQTQTALTAQWLQRGGPWFPYLTPVLGHPWTIPFELPLMQALVAGVSSMTGLDLDRAGRLVSFLSYLATLWPLHALAGALVLPPVAFPVAASLFLLAPLQFFWARTFMIESFSLLLALGFLALCLHAAQAAGRRRTVLWAAALVVGILGALVKVTTFAVPFILAAAAITWFAWDHHRRSGMAPAPALVQTLRTVLPVALLVFLPPVVLTKVWVMASDAEKARSIYGASTVSSALASWNFGTLAQRLDPGTWRGLLYGRAFAGSVGKLASLLLIAAGVVVLRGRLLKLAGWAMAGLVGAFLIFTNLHLRHDYYQHENAVFAVLAAALVIVAVWWRHQGAAIGLLLIVLASQGVTLARGYGPLMFQDLSGHPSLRVGALLKDRLGPDEVAVAWGGFDWSGEVAYYAARKVLTVPNWAEDPAAVLTQPERFIGDATVRAYVLCPGHPGEDVVRQQLTRLTTGWAHDTSTGCDVHLRP